MAEVAQVKAVVKSADVPCKKEHVSNSDGQKDEKKRSETPDAQKKKDGEAHVNGTEHKGKASGDKNRRKKTAKVEEEEEAPPDSTEENNMSDVVLKKEVRHL